MYRQGQRLPAEAMETSGLALIWSLKMDVFVGNGFYMFIPPIYGETGDGLLFVYPHYHGLRS